MNITKLEYPMFSEILKDIKEKFPDLNLEFASIYYIKLLLAILNFSHSADNNKIISKIYLTDLIIDFYSYERKN